MQGRGKLKLAILISGRGSNMLAIAHACREGRIGAEVALVIADRADAAGIRAAHELGIPTTLVLPPAPGRSADQQVRREQRDRFEAALSQAIDASGAQLVLLAGFMRILSPAFVHRYRGRLLNIHPSLLPKFKGLDTHRRALEAGEREHGATVHFVTEELDGGPIIAQARVAVQADDGEQELAARVLREEHRIYPMVVGMIAAGRLQLLDGAIELDGAPLRGPLAEEPPRAPR